MTLRAASYGNGIFSVDDDQLTKAGWNRDFRVYLHEGAAPTIYDCRGRTVKVDGRVGRQVMKVVNARIEKDKEETN